MPLNADRIKEFLKSGLTVYTFGRTDSTNNEAKRGLGRDRGRAVLYAADSQTAGRGRLGRDFYSPAGGLYMTLSLPLSGTERRLGRVTCAAAVAVCEAISALTGLSPAVKWVNDIYVDGRKVAGILAELVLDSLNRPAAIIIGVGVNLTTEAFPAEIADRAGRIGDCDPDRLCAAIADNIVSEYERLSDDSFLEKYIALNFCLGRRITYTDLAGEHTATAVTIAPDGALIVDEGGERRALSSGEVSIVPEAQNSAPAR